MALDTGAYSFCPELQIRTGLVVLFKDNLTNCVPQDRSLLRKFLNTPSSLVVGDGRLEETGETIDLFVQPPPGYGLRLAQFAQSARLVSNQIESVFDALEPLLIC